MSSVNGQKRRWGSKSVECSNHQGPSKIPILDSYRLNVTGGSASSELESMNSLLGPKGFKARFRRSGSRILSIFGIRATTATGSSPDSDYNIPVPLAKDASSPNAASNPLKAPPKDLDSPSDPLGPIPRGYNSCRSRSHDLIRSHSSLHVRKRSSSLRQSQSMPGLAHMLSHKISSTFSHPTVVHRSNLVSRPSIHSIKADIGPPPSDLVMLGDNTLDSTDPSSYAGSSSSPLKPSGSTAPTSDGLHSSPARSRPRSFSPLSQPKTISIFNSDEHKLTPIEEAPAAPVMMPSILTVEATATAKIFFETHFGTLLAGSRPRSQRRHELESRLYALNASPEARGKALQTWARQESDFLRKDRVLKSRTNGLKGSKGISVAGYEVVKVLGKGSFGVVRLVKEHPSSPPDMHISRTDLNQLKANAMDALLPSRRRSLTKMKKEVYAMKVIRKSDMLRNCQEGHLRAERDFLVASEGSRWVVPLIASFQDYNNLYLVMDYMVGGDFLGLLIRRNILSEDVTRWYIAEMILCIEESHRLRWIHRDVKPDNYLIGADGHLKISDFGLAFDGHWSHDQGYFTNHRHTLLERLGIKVEGDDQDVAEAQAIHSSRRLANVLTGNDGAKDVWTPPPGPDNLIVDWRNRNQKRQLAKSVVGTSQYMAPEVIRGELYDGRCDWWSIGIIMYECLYGFTPFACENRADTKMKILQHLTSLHFPTEKPSERAISDLAIDLINLILQEKGNRLSSRKYLLNDYPPMKAASYHSQSDKHCKDYQGNYVYADDADDIKSHPFFIGIKWKELHIRKPPFVPKVKSWEDTKYFEEDEPISDVDDASTDHESEDGHVPRVLPQIYGGAVAAARGTGHYAKYQAIQPDNRGKTVNEIIAAQNQALAAPVEAKKAKRKEQKRPRDRILRDPVVGRQALEMRKKGAFLGYNYRRHKPVIIEEVPQMTRARANTAGELID